MSKDLEAVQALVEQLKEENEKLKNQVGFLYTENLFLKKNLKDGQLEPLRQMVATTQDAKKCQLEYEKLNRELKQLIIDYKKRLSEEFDGILL